MFAEPEALLRGGGARSAPCSSAIAAAPQIGGPIPQRRRLLQLARILV